MADTSAAQLPTADQAFPDIEQPTSSDTSGKLLTADEAFPDQQKPTLIQNAIHMLAKPVLSIAGKVGPVIAPVDHIVDAFNKTASSYINGSYGMSEQTQKDMRDRGIWNDVGTQVNNTADIAKYFIRNAAEAIQRPATVGLDILQNVGGGVIAGATSAVAQAGVELGANPEKSEREANISAQGLLGQFPLGLKAGLGIPHFDPYIAPAAELNVPPVIAKGMATHSLDTEPVYDGTAEPSKESSLMAHAATPEIQPEPLQKPDIHHLARQIEPQLFNEYDQLIAQQNTLGRWNRELAVTHEENTRNQAPYNDEIAELQAKMADANRRKTKIYQAQIDELTEKNEDFVQNRGISPDMAHIQGKYNEVSNRLSEIADTGKLREAYQKAQEQMPKEEPAKAAEEVKPTEESHTDREERLIEEGKNLDSKDPLRKAISVAVNGGTEEGITDALKWAAENGRKDIADHIIEQARKDAEGSKNNAEKGPSLAKTNPKYDSAVDALAKAAKDAQERHRRLVNLNEITEPRGEAPDAHSDPETPKTPEPTKAVVDEHQSIVDDVVKKATAKGYGAEEAKASAELLARQYRYLADTYGGKKGSALDLYKKEAPEIIGQGERIGAAKTLNASAKGKYHILDDGRRMIRLMKSADASTLIHEGAHHFMDMMKRFAAEEGAPQKLKDDMAMLRRELGVKAGEDLKTIHEERFARGFERYVMEGHAPSKDLAGIFQKFQNWLKGIYQTVEKIPNSEISPVIKSFFDRTLQGNIESNPIIAPIEEAQNGPWGDFKPEPVAEETKQPVKSAIPSVKMKETGTIKDQPTNPNAKLGKSKNDLVDKAGNIRLDLLNTTDDIDTAIREVADENGGFIAQRRGKISNRQSLDFADALGLDPEQIDMRQVGRADNAETIIAKTKLLIQSAKETSDAAKSGDVEAYLQAKERQKMIQGHVSGITAEAGRALQIFQALKHIEGYDEATALSNFLKENDNGKTLNQLQEEMQFAAKLQTAQQVSKFVQDSKRSKFQDAIRFYYVNALLSGPITHARYAVGNAIMALWTPLVRIPTASVIGAGRELITGTKNADKIYLGEAGAQLYAMGKGARDGLDAAIQSYKTGVMASKNASQAMLSGTPHTAPPFPIQGIAGQIIGIPVKSVAAIHSFFYTLRYEQNIAGMAYREAAKQGLEGADFDLQVAKLTQSPTEEMIDAASTDSMKEHYMAPAKYDSFTAKLARVTDANLPAKVIVPFAKVGINITSNAWIDQSLLGLFSKDVRANISGVNGGAVRDMQMAKIATGTALMATITTAALEGNVTGDGPTDPNQRRVWLLTHKQNTITIGDVSFSYARLGSLSMLMRFSADMAETYKGWNGDDGDKLAVSAIEGLSKSVLDETFMVGIKNALDAMWHPEEYGGRYIQGLATAWIPFSSGLGQIDRETDPFQRDVRSHGMENAWGILDAAKARIPVLSETLQPRFDIFGNPIKNGSTYDQYKADPVVQKLEELHMGVSRLDRKIVGVQLTDKQYADYSQLAGYMTKQRLDALVNLNGFSEMPVGAQTEAIHKTISNARESARAVIKAENIDIIEQAATNKQKLLTGIK